MIVKMKKVTLLCMESERNAAMEKLRELGIMHVDIRSKVETAEVVDREQILTDAQRVYNVLQGYADKHTRTSLHPDGKTVLSAAQEKLEQLQEIEKTLTAQDREIELLQPWGEFDPAMVRKLAEQGIQILFCAAFPEEYNALTIPEETVRILVNVRGKVHRFLLISRQELDPSAFPVVHLPEDPLSVLREKRAETEREQRKVKDFLAELAVSLPELKQYMQKVAVEREFMTNRDGMVSNGEIAYLEGYVPVPAMEKLTATAHSCGWGVLAEDPALDDERVPTCLDHPKWMRIIDPLFEFIGITPGYREYDVTLFFLIAFPVFFGMLIGDFGYGALFMAAAGLCKYLFRKKPEAQTPLNLLILLAAFSMLWGGLTGSCLGIPRTYLPGFLQGLDFLAEPIKSPAARKLANLLHIENPNDLSSKFIQWFCFLLAGLHLSSARLYKFIDGIRNWRSWGHLGWACLIWANFFTAVSLVVFPGTFPTVLGYSLYGAGFLLIVATVTGEAILNLPSSLVGSFVDVLSYIRLFAVGMSGMYVGTCFNEMGVMMLDSLPKYLFIIGLVLLILIAIAGHIMNMLLGLMSVLVHAIRLNTLEFSNHIEMQWTGIPYRPFASRNK